MSQDLLIELGCEDLPARYVHPLAEALTQGMTAGLARRNVTFGIARGFATPRRIAVVIDAVAPRQPDQPVEKRGPAVSAAYKDGKPTPAALGFAKSCGVDFGQIEKLETEKGAWLVHRSVQKGRALGELVPEIFEETLRGMDELVPKRMRWGSGEQTFVRPVQWLAAMVGSQVLPLERFGLKSGVTTYGHRFHAPKAIALPSPAAYADKLLAAKVHADFTGRRDEIRRQIEAEARKLGGTARITDELLDEVTALVEWPVVISGRIEERFLELPSEVIIATIEHNQRYFPVFDGAGKLMPVFITVSNIESRDTSQVIAGNERVVRPRLTDAMFFWEQDRKQKLGDYVAGLDKVTFQKDLGTTGDKVRRVGALATHIAGLLGDDSSVVERAAALCKADLLTRMVFEFPELQGVMGGYYATAGGESAAVATAIREHHQPVQSRTPIPASRAGQILSLADKLDTLVGLHAARQPPSASKDPFGLRRAAIGVIRICAEGRLHLDMEAVLRHAAEHLPAALKPRAAEAVVSTLSFIEDRFFNFFEGQGYSAHVIEATRKWLEDRSARGQRGHDFVDLALRLDGLRQTEGSAELRRLGEAHKRIRNILKQAGDGEARVVEDLLKEVAERDLYESLMQLAGEVEQAVDEARYADGLRTLAKLQAPVDTFFERVMVLAEDTQLRGNRVALLRELDRLCRSIADISCLPG